MPPGRHEGKLGPVPRLPHSAWAACTPAHQLPLPEGARLQQQPGLQVSDGLHFSPVCAFRGTATGEVPGREAQGELAAGFQGAHHSEPLPADVWGRRAPGHPGAAFPPCPRLRATGVAHPYPRLVPADGRGSSTRRGRRPTARRTASVWSQAGPT